MSTARTAPLRLKAPFREVAGAAALQAPSSSCHGVVVKAICPGQTVYLGVSGALTTANGFPLADGATLDLAVKNTDEIWHIASAAAQGLSLWPYSMY